MDCRRVSNDDFATGSALGSGDSVWWINRGRHQCVFDPCAGKWLIVAFLGAQAGVGEQAALQALKRGAAGCEAAFFIAPHEIETPAPHRENEFPSFGFLWRAEELRRAFGVERAGRCALVSPALRVVEIVPLIEGEVQRLLRKVGERPTLLPAPILILPDVFEPSFSRRLIDVFDRHGGAESGFMDGPGPRQQFDQRWKRRRDVLLSDPQLIAGVRARIGRRVCPEIKKAFQFTVSRIERHLIGRYDAEGGGHFGPHRDDAGSALVAHRRFALSIPLNDDFEGGELLFPEYRRQSHNSAAGTAIVFSASLLHLISPVTRGRRYVFLTFLFDEPAERQRLTNLTTASAAAVSAT